MWTRNLEGYLSSGQIGEGLDLQAVLMQDWVDQKTGDAGVVVYDANKSLMYQVWILDAWYSSTSYAYVAYYPLGAAAVYQSEQKTGSWSGTLRMWYDKDADAIKATVPGRSWTLATNPPEYELDRVARYVAVYFDNYQDLRYDSKFIDYIKLTDRSSSYTGFMAHYLTPAMEGHWFPRMDYSRLYFKVSNPNPDQYWTLKIHIVADQDTIDRFLTVYVDDTMVYQNVITVAAGFDGGIRVNYPLLNTRKVILQINWGANVEKGWKLVYFYPERWFGEPLQILGEYFPQQGQKSWLTYRAILGTDSHINLKMESDQDTYPRFLRVYVDGQLKADNGPGGDGAWQWELGNYSDGSTHEVKLELEYGGWKEWGKILTINRASYFRAGVEIDYMAELKSVPNQDDLNYLTSYYINLGYDRVEFYLDQQVTYKQQFLLAKVENGLVVPDTDYWTYYNTYRGHSNDPKWEWVLYGHLFLGPNIQEGTEAIHWPSGYYSKLQDGRPWPINTCYGIFVLDDRIPSPGGAGWRRSLLMHEFGHHLGIVDWWVYAYVWTEAPCINSYCAMQYTFLWQCPYYCQHHWSQHRWRGG